MAAANDDDVVGRCEWRHATRQAQGLQDIDLRIHDIGARLVHLADDIDLVSRDPGDGHRDHGFRNVCLELLFDLRLDGRGSPPDGDDLTRERKRELAIRSDDDLALQVHLFPHRDLDLIARVQRVVGQLLRIDWRDSKHGR